MSVNQALMTIRSRWFSLTLAATLVGGAIVAFAAEPAALPPGSSGTGGQPTPPPMAKPPAPSVPPVVGGGAPLPPPMPTPDPGQYWLDLAMVHQRYDMADDAEKCFTKALDVAKTPAFKIQVLTSWGEGLIRKGKAAEGVAKQEQALALADDARTKSRIAYSLARSMEQAGKIDDAVKYYEIVIASADEPFQREAAQNQMISALQRTGGLDPVIKRSEETLAQDPKNESALRMLQAIYTRFKPDAANAVRVMERMIEVNPKDANTLAQLSDQYLRMKEMDKAEAVLAKLIDADPAQKARHIERFCNSLMANGQKEKAVEWATKLAEADPRNVQSWMRLGDLYMRADETAKATAAFEKAVTLAATDQERDMLRLRHADALRGAGKADQALAIYKDLAEKAKAPYIMNRAKQQLASMQGGLEKPRPDAPGEKPKPMPPMQK